MDAEVTLFSKPEELIAWAADSDKEQSRLETLKNIAERYDGYGNSIRRRRVTDGRSVV